MDPEQEANIAEYEARKAFQAWLDTKLTPASQTRAETTRVYWQPIEDFQKEGPDVGFRQEAESKDCRIN